MSGRGDVRPVRRRSVAWGVVFTAASQVANMGLGAVLGILAVQQFGKGVETDAIFAAHGVYGLVLMLCSSFRATVVSRLAEDPRRFVAFDRLLGAGLVVLLVLGVVLVGLGGSVAALITGSLGPTALSLVRASLAILWLGGAGQLVAALASATLGVRGEFGWPSVGYVLAALTSIAVLVTTAPLVGVLAVPGGVAAGSALVAGVTVARLVRHGYRPNAGAIVAGARQARVVVLMMAGSVLPLVVQVNYLISLSFAAELGVGAVTLYTYAYSAAALVIGATAAPCSIVLATPLAERWDRRPGSLGPFMQPVLRLGLVLTLPAFGVGLLLGGEALEWLFGPSLSGRDVATILAVFLALIGSAVAILALQIPQVAAYTLSRHRRVALVSLGSVAAHLLLTSAATASGQLPLLGLATSASTLVLLGLVLTVIYGRAALIRLLHVLGETARVGVACAAVFLPAWVAAQRLDGGGWAIAFAAAAVVAFALVLRLCLPRHLQLLTGAIRSMTRGGPTQVPRAGADPISTTT